MVSESLISDVFEFPSVFNFPQPVEGFECHGCKDAAGQAHCEQRGLVGIRAGIAKAVRQIVIFH